MVYGDYNRTVPVRVLYPYAVAVSTDNAQLNPVAGWFDETNDPSCRTYTMQSTRAPPAWWLDTMSRPFSIIGVADVASSMQGRWRSSHTEVAGVNHLGVVTGSTTPGTATISFNGVLTLEVDVTVTNTPILMVGLDVAHYSSLSVSSNVSTG